jgi:four helix bundle protein
MFRIIEEIIELAPVMERYGRVIAPRSPELAKQLRKAWPRVMCNTNEALHRMGGKTTNRLDDAMGEAREAHGVLRYAIACGYIGGEHAEWALDRVDKVVATLYKLAHKRAA